MAVLYICMPTPSHRNSSFLNQTFLFFVGLLQYFDFKVDVTSGQPIHTQVIYPKYFEKQLYTIILYNLIIEKYRVNPTTRILEATRTRIPAWYPDKHIFLTLRLKPITNRSLIFQRGFKWPFFIVFINVGCQADGPRNPFIPLKAYIIRVPT